MADKLLLARRNGDYSRDAFLPLETVTNQYLAFNDRLIANSFRSFANYKLWQVYAVMWLLGAYTEYLMLNGIRARSQGDRATYMQFLYGMHLVGGGFAGFRPISNQVDTIIEQVDPHDEEAVDKAVAEINRIFRSIDWMPEPFLALLDGATFLPKNKLRLSLLKKDEGFLGKGDYRKHFFGEHSTAEMLRVFVKEKIRYSRAGVGFGRKFTKKRLSM